MFKRNFLSYTLALLILLGIPAAYRAQELNCQVSVVSQQVQGTTEKQIFDQLQKAIFEFMNNTKWTGHSYTVQERIDCSILINVDVETKPGSISGHDPDPEPPPCVQELLLLAGAQLHG